jgi:hypothetical protein
MEQLRFISTQTVEQFKADQRVSKLEVRQNPHSGKLFFTYGSSVGAVSSKGIPSNPMISKVEGSDGQFFLLHEEGQGGAPVLASF